VFASVSKFVWSVEPGALFSFDKPVETSIDKRKVKEDDHNLVRCPFFSLFFPRHLLRKHYLEHGQHPDVVHVMIVVVVDDYLCRRGVVISREFSFFVIHNHFINKKNFFSPAINYEANFPLFFAS